MEGEREMERGGRETDRQGDRVREREGVCVRGREGRDRERQRETD